MTMPFAELEPVYEELAAAIDRVGEGQAPLFLAKLVLMLAQELGDRERALAAIAACERNLERP